MGGNKIETTTGMCVVALTRHIMRKRQMNYEDAYKALLATELYKLLQDEETRLFLEPNEYLCKAYDQEDDYGKDALYKYINE